MTNVKTVNVQAKANVQINKVKTKVLPKKVKVKNATATNKKDNLGIRNGPFGARPNSPSGLVFTWAKEPRSACNH